MNKFSVTYQIGQAKNLETICTRFVQADDADMAVVKVLAEKTEGDYPLSSIIMLKVTDVQRVTA
jgi:hypothetical protein